ncbi:MAG: TlpA family protein disulfide reductase [Clostridiales bacterium]|nr:TlpA family protein disulfide reductase [Clostridiales bacterium]
MGRNSIAAVLAALVLLAGCASGSSSAGTNQIPVIAAESTAAASAETESTSSGTDYGFGRIPEFSASDLDGKTFDNALFKEKDLTFINYWATWCPPCRGELPDFQALYDQYGDRITFVTVIDDAIDNAEAGKLADEYLSFCVNLTPDSRLISELQTGYVPTSVIVDSDGNLVIDKMIGAYGGEYAGYIDEALEKVE